MGARVVAVGAGADGAGSGSSTVTVLTVPANVDSAVNDSTLVVATWQATALETPPSSVMLGGSGGWATLVAPRTDGTMGWAVYAGRGLSAGDLVAHQLGAARSVHLLDVYVRDAAAPASWVAGVTTARVATSVTTLAAGMALAEASAPVPELNLAISVERSTTTGTVVSSSPGAIQIQSRETPNATNLTSIWFGQLPGITTPSLDVTITVNTTSANGAALQLAIPAYVSASTGLLHPNSELVTVAWLKGIPYLGSRVATELPTSSASAMATWSASGFVTVAAAGGSAPMYVPLRQPIMDVTTWAAANRSGRPPWGQAGALAEAIETATLAHATVPRKVAMPNAGYAPAFVRSAWLVTEPRRAPGDVGDFACYTMDLALDWVEVPT